MMSSSTLVKKPSRSTACSDPRSRGWITSFHNESLARFACTPICDFVPNKPPIVCPAVVLVAVLPAVVGACSVPCNTSATRLKKGLFALYVCKIPASRFETGITLSTALLPSLAVALPVARSVGPTKGIAAPIAVPAPGVRASPVVWLGSVSPTPASAR